MGVFTTRIGVIGAGQLGLKLAEAASPLKLGLNFLDKAPDFPAAAMAYRFIEGSLNSREAIRDLAAISDVITYEIEHVNTQALRELELEGHVVIPPSEILDIIKDKGKQKSFYKDNGIPTSPFYLATCDEEWRKAPERLPGFNRFVAKSCTGGYDGRGVFVFDKSDYDAPFPLTYPAIIEGFIDHQKELAVIVARDTKGNTKVFPVVEMVFKPQANLVDYLACPASITDESARKATDIALDAANKLRGAGLFAVEMFLDASGSVFVNEIAPRPHNSGHHTIEACQTSQYQQLLRILLGLPLGNTQLMKPAVMYNILGPDGFSGAYCLDNPEKLFAMDQVYLHMYGKSTTSPNRKLGHITILGNTLKEALDKLPEVKEHTRIVPE